MFDRIIFDSQIIGGQARIRGRKITVSFAIDLVANGMSVEEILKEYPDLEADDISQALQYGAMLEKLPPNA